MFADLDHCLCLGEIIIDVREMTAGLMIQLEDTVNNVLTKTCIRISLRGRAHENITHTHTHKHTHTHTHTPHTHTHCSPNFLCISLRYHRQIEER